MEFQLTASLRGETGKGAAHRLRRSGQIPAVLCRPGQDSIPLSLEARALGHAATRGALTRLITLTADKGKYAVLVKEIQYDPVKGQPIHVDFVEVALNDPVEVKVPVSLLGDSRKTVDGGVIGQLLYELSVSCLPKAIPDRFEVSTENLAVGNPIYVKDLTVPAGIKVLTDPDEIVVLATHAVASAEKAGDEQEEAVPGQTDKAEEE